MMDTTRSSSAPILPVDRRSFLGLAAGAVASVAVARDFGPGAEPTRYPDPDIVVIDPRFQQYKLGNTPIQRLHTGLLWAEGPAWNAVGRYFICSDIPNDIQIRWLEEDGHVSVFRHPAGNSNGNTFDYQGRQISCEHGNRRVVRYEHDGKMTVVADKFEGKPFNAPNDAVVHPTDGAIWFTDPGYGSMVEYEGHKRKLELKEAVYRVDAQTGKVEKVTDEIEKPNGLCFSPDYKLLYVSDTGAPKDIKVWDVADGKALKNPRQFTGMKFDYTNDEGKTVKGDGLADGIRCDVDGNIWAAGGWVGAGYDGVHVFAKDGTRIGQIKLPEIGGNLCFGGSKGNRLFICAGQSVYSVYVETRGAHIT
jgi:gluconolactonase